MSTLGAVVVVLCLAMGALDLLAMAVHGCVTLYRRLKQ